MSNGDDLKKLDKNDDTNYFGVSKYGRDRGLRRDALVDMSDSYANFGQYVISFQHIATGKTVFFKAFVNDYSETFNCAWSPTTVYGRTDPIQNYTGTSRNISLAFNVPASSVGEAYENMGRISKLVQMLYPTYMPNEDGTGMIIGQAPLVRVKMMNLITRERMSVDDASRRQNIGDLDAAIDPPKSPQEALKNYQTSPLPENGVLSAISSISYRSDLQNIQIFEKAPNTVLPQSLTVTLGFAVIHEETIGWDASTGEPLAESFPHKIRLAGTPDGMKAVDSDQKPADVDVRIAQERANQARIDSDEALKNKFLDRLIGSTMFSGGK
tara:strand:- start:456 stop:1433 length:978 start_codon:yes stop_codon:yes gene_type:complete